VNRILKAIKAIEKQVGEFKIPWVTEVSKRKDPYRVLVSCILSLRTKDKTTAWASQRLFRVVDTPGEMVKLPISDLKRLIYPVGFYRNKAKVILEISKRLIKDFNGIVPNKIEDLLAFKGVGRKTANLVLGLGYKVPSICVDTHVHRISNRLGWVRTIKPEQTEEALKKIIPKAYWIKLNTILVAFGQNICLPISPYCSKCYVNNFCRRIGVDRFR
jgi:endonuclease-3